MSSKLHLMMQKKKNESKFNENNKIQKSKKNKSVVSDELVDNAVALLNKAKEKHARKKDIVTNEKKDDSEILDKKRSRLDENGEDLGTKSSVVSLITNQSSLPVGFFDDMELDAKARGETTKHLEFVEFFFYLIFVSSSELKALEKELKIKERELQKSLEEEMEDDALRFMEEELERHKFYYV
jgi:hypothetical protein